MTRSSDRRRPARPRRRRSGEHTAADEPRGSGVTDQERPRRRGRPEENGSSNGTGNERRRRARREEPVEPDRVEDGEAVDEDGELDEEDLDDAEDELDEEDLDDAEDELDEEDLDDDEEFDEEFDDEFDGDEFDEDELEDELDEEDVDDAEPEPEPEPEPKKPIPARKIARWAAEQVFEMSGKESESVTSVRRNDEGWSVSLEVVESHKIPDTADLMAIYEAEMDADGELLSYKRTRRYTRGRGDDE